MKAIAQADVARVSADVSADVSAELVHGSADAEAPFVVADLVAGAAQLGSHHLEPASTPVGSGSPVELSAVCRAAVSLAGVLLAAVVAATLAAATVQALVRDQCPG